MKKPLLFIALAAVFACKDKPKENKEEVQEEMTEVVEEKESEWDEMFATIRCNRCG